MKLIALAISCILLSACSSYIQPDLPHKVEFENAPCIKPNGARFRTCDELNVLIDNNPYSVPAGFDTDLASVPNLFWSVLSPAEAKMMAPAILHDYMYQCPNILSRRYADDVFYSALVQEDMRVSSAYQMYSVIRMFGDKYFKEGAKCEYLKEIPLKEIPENDPEIN